MMRSNKAHWGWPRAALLAAVGATASTALAGLIEPPQFDVKYIGPGASCDYATIQQAIEEEFSCTFLCTRLGKLQLRLTDGYSHSGDIELSNPLNLVGGFPSCGSPYSGNRKVLSGNKIIVNGPVNNPVEVTLANLSLIGGSSFEQLGGVIELTGGADLTIDNSFVSNGLAVQGGGIAMHGPGNRLTLSGSSVFMNQATEEGGGIWCQGGAIDFISGAVRRNETDQRGGGLFLDDCSLVGNTPGVNRSVELNTVRKSNPGKGGGLYLTNGASVILGALSSHTEIDRNQILRDPPVTQFGDAIGGGVHVQRGELVLRNVHVTGNVAPAGAAISAGSRSGATIHIDRLSGPCADGSASSGQSECSLIAGNIASGRENDLGVLSGFGVVFWGFAKSWVLKRTTVRDNRADCDGDCERPSGSLFHVWGPTNSSGLFQIEQSLIVDNFLDATCNTSCDLEPATKRVGMFRVRDYATVELVRNTISRNDYKDSTDNDVKDFLIGIDGPWSAIGNVIWDNQIEDLMDPVFENGAGSLAEAICNVSNYQALNDDAATTTGNTEEDPLLEDPAGGDYRVASNSPALNRCDDVDGTLTETYDVAGRAMPRDHFEPQTGLNGYHDAGAHEHQLIVTPNEIDLAVAVTQADTEPPNAVFEAVLANIGPATAQSGNFALVFNPPTAGYQQLDDDWACIGLGGSVRCEYLLIASLPAGLSTLPLVIEVLPDAIGECFLIVNTDSGSQPDVVSVNNATSGFDSDCDGDGVLPEEIFGNGFETDI